MNKQKIFLILLLIISISGFFIIPKYVLAEDDSGQEQVEDLEDKIKDYEKKLNDLNNQEQSLNKEIEYMNSQISLTELRIQSSEAKISKTSKAIEDLTKDIEDLKVRIGKLKDSIEYQQEILSSRMRESYKSKGDNFIVVIFGSDTLNSLIQKTEYLKVMEKHDNKLLDEMEKTKNAYDNQKGIFEDKREEEENLKKQLENERAVLAGNKKVLEDQKSEKKRLLEVTQNDEVKYQNLLAEAQRELNQIVGAVSVLINQTSREVKKGEIIGIQGNSGYSFGDHLHFGVYKYGSFEDIDGWNWYYSNYVDPSKKLEKKTVYWNTGCESSDYRTTGKGDWDWPMKNPTISQGFGTTCWSKVYYGGKPHPAYDMYGSVGSAIYAVEDGDAYFCRNCLGDGGNGVFIFHDDDYMTVYWHLR